MSESTTTIGGWEIDLRRVSTWQWVVLLILGFIPPLWPVWFVLFLVWTTEPVEGEEDEVWRCQLCGETVPDLRTHIDEAHPEALGDG